MKDLGKTVNTFEKGLVTDLPREYTPQNNYTYALNATMGYDEENGAAILHNEYGNRLSTEFTDNHKILGSIIIRDGIIVIFSVKHTPNKPTESQISLLMPDETLKVIVNDKDSPENLKLNFDLSYPIKATYRIKEGCGDILYWTDNHNKPYSLNISKLENYKTGGFWDKNKFFLQKGFKTIPKLKNIKVNDSGGSLKSGSIIPVIQYLDADKNPTRWINDYKPVNIYYNSLLEEYSDIIGSITTDKKFLNKDITTKSLELEFENLDENYPYYRLGFIEFNTGTGEAVDIKVTNLISVKTTKFVYTGDNYKSSLPVDEVYKFNALIAKAKTIEQIDSKLLLGNIEEVNINYCELQKVASKINVDAVVEEVIVSEVEEDSSKNPIINYKKLGYQPGEIYSLGIVCVLEGNIETPVFHIPGKPEVILASNSNNIANSVTFTQGANIIPMSTNNKNQNQTYLDENYCSEDYWGVDGLGNKLKGTNIRHHRFPSRKEANLGFVTKEQINITMNTQTIHITTTVDTGSGCVEEDSENCYNVGIKIQYKLDGILNTNILFIPWLDVTTSGSVIEHYIEDIKDGVTISDVTITYIYNGGADAQNPVLSGEYTIDTVEHILDQKTVYKAKILGLKLSNIKIPEYINGVKVLGYYIVRNIREKDDKTVLDSGILTPMLYDKPEADARYIAAGVLNPDMNFKVANLEAGANNSSWFPSSDQKNKERYSKKYFSLTNLSTLFKNESFSSFDSIEQQGIYVATDTAETVYRVLDVRSGSTKTDDDDIEDDDGWSLRTAVKDTKVEYTELENFYFNFSSLDIDKVQKLSPLSRYVDDDIQVWNLSLDNTITTIKLKENISTAYDNLVSKIPYVYLKRNKEDNYYNFKLKPYFKISNSIRTGEEIIEFGGDTHITSLRYATSSFYKYEQGLRGTKSSIWDFVLAVILIVATIVLFVPSGGSSLTLVGLAYSFAKTGITKEKMSRAFLEHYKKGLDRGIIDRFFYEMFEYTYEGINNSPSGLSTLGTEDDEINMTGEVLTDVWFESQINAGLRLKIYDPDITSFLNSPGEIEKDSSVRDSFKDEIFLDNSWVSGSGDNFYVLGDKEMLPKTTVGNYFLDKMTIRNDRNKREFTMSKPEFYELNPDYNNLNISYPYFHLPETYDCCSKCNNRYPTRMVYSQKSFDEEQTDNYRKFLPNNYKDINSDTGEIKDIVNYYDDLYIFTDTIYKAIREHQERVTGDIVSFIGTGSYLQQSPKKLIDDESFGNIPSWSTINTPEGMLIVSYKNKKVYLLLPGGKLKNISDNGNSGLFKKLLEQNFKEQYTKYAEEKYPFEDLSNSKYGTGIRAVYDSLMDRFIFSKRDYLIKDISIFSGNKICKSNNIIYLYENLLQIIEQYTSAGYYYRGEKNCNLTFTKYNTTPHTYTVYNNGTGVDIEGNSVELEIVKVPPTRAIDLDILDKSFTISYNLKNNVWTSFHSYIPNIFIQGIDKYYSFINQGKGLWKHNIKSLFNSFYGKKESFIVEITTNEKNKETFTTEDIIVRSEQEKFNIDLDETYPSKDFFNEIILYNKKQTSGKLNLKLEDLNDYQYLFESVSNSNLKEIRVSVNEEDYAFNDFRDFTNNKPLPIFTEKSDKLQDEYFTDKVLNEEKLDNNKNWDELERFRDKYLVIRLIFNKFVDVKFNLYRIYTTIKKSNR